MAHSQRARRRAVKAERQRQQRINIFGRVPDKLWAVFLKYLPPEPSARPPLRVLLVEGMTQKASPLGDDAQIRLPDGRWLVFWETAQPRRYETYSLKWEW